MSETTPKAAKKSEQGNLEGTPSANAAKTAELTMEQRLAAAEAANARLVKEKEQLEETVATLSSAVPAVASSATIVEFGKRKYEVTCGVQIPTGETFEYEGTQYTCKPGTYLKEDITSNSSILAKLLRNGSNVIKEVV